MHAHYRATMHQPTCSTALGNTLGNKHQHGRIQSLLPLPPYVLTRVSPQKRILGVLPVVVPLEFWGVLV